MSIFTVHSPLRENVDPAPDDRLRSACIAELVSVQALSMPEAIAVADKDHVLTYKGLDARAKQLAQHLRALGVGPNVVVGLCLPRSVGMVVGALGILKTGGAYLPLDPTYPTARIAFEFNDTQVSVVVA